MQSALSTSSFMLSPLAGLSPAAPGDAARAGEPAAPDAAVQATADLGRLHELVGRVGRELAEPLTTGLERLSQLMSSGRMDAAGLKALQADLERARQAGIWCQQIARLASGRVRPSHERVHLTNTLQSVLAHRARELQARGVHVSLAMSPVEVHADAPLLFSLLNGLVDWWLACARGTVEVRLDIKSWPVHAQLQVKLQHRPADLSDGLPEGECGDGVDSLPWQLSAQVARAMGLGLDRQVSGPRLQLTLEFPHTVNPLLAPEADEGADAGFSTSLNSRPLAGSHVLVVAARRDVRLLVREAVRGMGLVVDFVSSVAEAAQFCHGALPHAVVFQASLQGRRMDELVAGLRKEVPEFALVEVLEEGDLFETSEARPDGVARVGREALLRCLPQALIHELSRAVA